MRQLRHGSSAQPIHFDLPAEWDPTLLSALSVAVNDRDGAVLMSADAATLYTATTLDGAVSRYSDEITLASGAGALKIGDALLLVGAEGELRAIVKGWDNATKTAQLEAFTELEFADGDAVYGTFADYSLDVSDTDVYTAGIVIELIWTPTATGRIISQQVQVSNSVLDIAGLELQFQDAYERAYDAFKSPRDKFDRMVKQAERQLSNELEADGLDIQRIVNQDDITPMVMAAMARAWVMNGDKDSEDERMHIGAEYDRQIGILKKMVISTDDNQDGVEDDDEVGAHPHIFQPGW